MTVPVDHDARFIGYYAQEGLSAEAQARFKSIMELLLRARGADGLSTAGLVMGDIGCAVGAQSIIWAKAGHRVYGLDISAGLIEIARERAHQAGVQVELSVGSATDLPWADNSVDICIAPELLEHVPAWERVLDECARVTRPGGLVYLSTANRLCPKQSEFDLPLYSWYPGFLKRRYERLAVTTRPELVNHAKFPAVNWFTFYSLRRALRKRGLSSRDRFDLLALQPLTGARRLLVQTICALGPLRWLGQVLTPYVVVLGRKEGATR